MTTRDPRPVQQLAGLLEALSGLAPIPNEEGYAFMRGEDIPGADVDYLRGMVALRDLLVGIHDYLRVCGCDGQAPAILIWRGELAAQELQRRHEWPYYGPARRRRIPSGPGAAKPGAEDKKQVRKRRRGQIPDVEVGSA